MPVCRILVSEYPQFPQAEAQCEVRVTLPEAEDIRIVCDPSPSLPRAERLGPYRGTVIWRGKSVFSDPLMVWISTSAFRFGGTCTRTSPLAVVNTSSPDASSWSSLPVTLPLDDLAVTGPVTCS